MHQNRSHTGCTEGRGDRGFMGVQVYRGMMDLCVSKFKESEGLYVGPNQAGYCLLRSQLLMAFHDNASFRQLANEVCSGFLLQVRNALPAPVAIDRYRDVLKRYQHVYTPVITLLRKRCSLVNSSMAKWKQGIAYCITAFLVDLIRSEVCMCARECPCMLYKHGFSDSSAGSNAHTVCRPFFGAYNNTKIKSWTRLNTISLYSRSLPHLWPVHRSILEIW